MEDDTIIQSIRKMVEKKISLYHDLHRCFQEERTALLQVDVTHCGAFPVKKMDYAQKISLLRKEIATAAAPWVQLEPFELNALFSVMPRAYFSSMNRAGQELVRLKRGDPRIEAAQYDIYE